MTVIEKRPVPIYETRCPECRSVLHYRKSEVSLSHIKCPVCGMVIWADTTKPCEWQCDADTDVCGARMNEVEDDENV